ncbi:MAG: threonylcarbamoyl-AMP synthase [Oligoflexales bacterium]|nr:threonylcarbamoyl-AMP synthase [Oligoflexales bacterium]
MTEHIYTYINPPSEKHLEKACKLLSNDGVLVYPMGNNWSLGCDAGNVRAIDRIWKLKPTHPKERPFTLICNNISMASTVGNIDSNLYRILKKVWPGPFTIIVKRNRSLPRQIKDKRHVVGIRIPDSPLVLHLVEKYGFPLATTSVPLKPDETPYRSGYEIYDSIGHGIDLLLDLGEELPGLESTIFDCSEGEPVLIREGSGDPGLFKA